jgi:hypothetical protein
VRFLFLNQYFPPDPAPTGVLLREMAEALEQAGHTIDSVAARQDYRNSHGRGGRMRRELMALVRMLFDGLRRPRPEVVVSGSSPPCLLVVATLVAWWHRAHSVHWAMDLYPEVAVALGEVREGALARTIAAVMGWGYRRAAQVVVLDEDMAVRLRRYGVKPEIIRPWVISPVLEQLATSQAEVSAEWTWIYSGNLGRAHEWETLLQAQAWLEAHGAGIRLVFQGGGRSWAAAQARARELGLRQIEWRGYVAEEELPASLLRCHALAVTQLPEAQGLLWPSKLALASSLPRPIAWVGPADGAIARLLRTLPQVGIFAPGEAEALARWLIARKIAGAPALPAPGFDPAAHRAQALDAWRRLLTALP